MKNINFFYINKLSDLHDNKQIFFCKTDFLEQDFDTISKLNTEVILISGNSDYSINDNIVNIAPKNIKKWYCQNALSNNDIIYPIPIGMENKTFASRIGHGIAYPERVTEKENIINNLPSTIESNKFIYANFTCETNFTYRIPLKNYIQNIDYIDWEEPRLSLYQLFNKFLEYKMILCPVGNGVDTHRLWEVLYCNRIPITIKVGDYKIYRLYEQLPIIILDNVSQLSDYDLIQKLYQINKTKLDDKENIQLLYSNYWIKECAL